MGSGREGLPRCGRDSRRPLRIIRESNRVDIVDQRLHHLVELELNVRYELGVDPKRAVLPEELPDHTIGEGPEVRRGSGGLGAGGVLPAQSPGVGPVAAGLLDGPAERRLDRGAQPPSPRWLSLISLTTRHEVVTSAAAVAVRWPSACVGASLQQGRTRQSLYNVT